MTKEKPLSAAVLQNFHSLYSLSTPEERSKGEDWYRRALGQAKNISENTLAPLHTVVGIIAALSPGLAWEKNLEQAARFIRAKGQGTFGVYGRRNAEKARRILKGESPLDVLKGRKVRAFYCAILGEDSLVIDSHMHCAALGIREGRWDRSRRVPYEWIASHLLASNNRQPKGLERPGKSELRTGQAGKCSGTVRLAASKVRYALSENDFTTGEEDTAVLSAT